MIIRISKNNLLPCTHALSPPEVPDLLDPTGATSGDAYVVRGHSPVDIDNHKPSSWKVVHQCVLTCSHVHF